MIYVGTSGWSYKHWEDGVFYPQGWNQHQLKYYQQLFNSVEINSSFYHLPKKKTFENWYKLVPDDFVFAVKGSRFISHVLKLKNAEEPLSRLLENAAGLKEKLGPILWQFSPGWEKNLKRLEGFCKFLPANLRFAFEFRHPSCFDTQVYQLLNSYQQALVIADTPNYPCVKELTTDFAYLRLHGHEKLYGSEYSISQLEGWAKLIKKWEKETSDIYIYFDNDAYGYAPKNARELKKILSSGEAIKD